MYIDVIAFVLGLILVVDGVVSIILARVNRVSYNLFKISSRKIVLVGHVFRALRVLIGGSLILASFSLINLDNFIFYIGIYLVLDAFFSIITSKDFDSFDDYFRII